MTVLKSALTGRDDTFRRNAERMRSLVADLREQVIAVKQGGGARSQERHVSRGKLLPRDRVRTLLDPGAPWLTACMAERFPPAAC